MFGAPPTQFKFALQAWELAPLHDEIVPADTALAGARPRRATKATWIAVVIENLFMDHEDS